MIVIYFTIMVIIFISRSYYHCYYIRHYHHTNPKSVVRRPSRLATALWCYPSDFKEENLQKLDCQILLLSILGLVIKRGGASIIVHWSHL